MARGRDLEAAVQITYAESRAGCTRTCNLERRIVCPNCRGTQARGGTTKRCPSCNATGKQQRMHGTMLVQQPCIECEGRGRVAEMWCQRCDDGLAEELQMLRVSVPAGVVTGQRIRVAGFGDEVVGGEAGDLFLEVTVDMIDVLVTRGDDVVLETYVTTRQRMLGGPLVVATLDGPMTIHVPRRVRDGHVITLEGKGHVRAPVAATGDPYRGIARGEQRIVLRVRPVALSPRDRKILQISVLVAAATLVTWIVV